MGRNPLTASGTRGRSHWSVNLLAFAVCVLLSGCGGKKDADPCMSDATGPGCAQEIRSVRLSRGAATLVGIGSALGLTAIPIGRDSAVVPAALISWTSQNQAVAVVEGTGATVNVRAVGRGVTNVTATASNASGSATASGVARITVADVISVTIQPRPTQPISVGTMVALSAAVVADAGLSTIVNWTTSNVSVTTVSANGVVTARGAGTATISAISSVNASIRDQITLTVLPAQNSVASVTVSFPSVCLSINQTMQGQASLRDTAGNALSGRIVSWSTSNAPVASVSGAGVVSGISLGGADITATSEGRSDTKTLTVSAPVASVAVQLGVATLSIGGTTQASATALDCARAPVVGRPVAWSSSNTAIATVSSQGGLVTAMGAGTATIVAAIDGVFGGINVTVGGPSVASLSAVSSTAQNGIVGASASDAPRVRALASGGAGVPGVPVQFAVTSGQGSVSSNAPVNTDSQGYASVSWTLGPIEGTQEVSATIPGSAATGQPALFRATVTNPVAAIESETGQTSQAGTILAPVGSPPSVRVKKASGAPAPGIDVTFVASAGNGTINGSPSPVSVVRTTDAAGIARLASWTLGPALGTQALTARAQLALPGQVLPFTASAAAPLVQVLTTTTNGRASTQLPLDVRVTGVGGVPLVGVPVSFAAASIPAGSSFSPVTPSTNVSGDASTFWTLGPKRTTYSGTLTIGTFAQTVSAIAVNPPLNLGVIRGVVVQVNRGGSTTPLSGVTITIAGPTPGSPTTDLTGLYESPDLAGGTYTFTAPVALGKIREIRFNVKPTLGQIISLGPLRLTPGNSQGPIEIQLVGTGAFDPNTIVEMFAGNGGDGNEPGRPAVSISRQSAPNLDKWSASPSEGFFLVRATVPGKPIVFKDCDIIVQLNAGTTPVCSVPLP